MLTAPQGVEIAVRYKNDAPIIFVLNHNAESAAVDLADKTYRNLLTGQPINGALALKGYDAAILSERA